MDPTANMQLLFVAMNPVCALFVGMCEGILWPFTMTPNILSILSFSQLQVNIIWQVSMKTP